MKEPLIFDTSVWINFFRGEDSLGATLLEDYIKNDEQVLLIPTIIQEILQGIKGNKQYLHVKDILSYLPVLPIPPVEAAIGAADLYRYLRKIGVTIRKSNDCLIAFFAIKFTITLVHSDSDFYLISKHTNLKTID